MKGIVLAGGSGTRLRPITNYLNKHLFPVYNKPMILFPIETLRKSGIGDILVVTDKYKGEKIIEFLGSGIDFDVSLTYRFQEEPKGIANAIKISESYLQGESSMVMLGDNITLDSFVSDVESFSGGSKIFLKKVDDPSRFGIAKFSSENRLIDIIEKPKDPPSNFAVSGIYLFDNTVFDKIGKCTPSERGEQEITDVLKLYLLEKKLQFRILDNVWIDAGTFESLYQASTFVRNLVKHPGQDDILSETKARQ